MTTPAPSGTATFDRKNAAQAEALGWATPLYRNALRRVFLAQGTPRAAIKAKCLECTGYERDEITTCTGYGCPLWAYRPYQARSRGGAC